MSASRTSRRLFQVILTTLLALDLVAAAVLLSPALGAGTAQFVEAERVRQLWKEEMRRASTVKDIDQKIAEARTQVAEFGRTRLPVRDSAIAEELGRLVTENGAHFSGIHYTADEDAIAGLRRVQVDASIAGDYLKVVKFINALERDKMFFLVNSVTLAEQQGGNVRLELKLETYLREAGSAPSGGAGMPAQPENASAPKTGKRT